METVQLLFTFLNAQIWPICIVVILIIFRPYIGHLVKLINKAKIADVIELEVEANKASNSAIQMFGYEPGLTENKAKDVSRNLPFPIKGISYDSAFKEPPHDRRELLHSAKSDLVNIARNMAVHYKLLSEDDANAVSASWLLATLREKRPDLIPEIDTISKVIVNLEQLGSNPNVSTDVADRLVISASRISNAVLEKILNKSNAM